MPALMQSGEPVPWQSPTAERTVYRLGYDDVVVSWSE